MPCFATAARAVANAEDEAETAAEEEESLEQRLIKDNILVSRFFDSVADGIDIFLAGERTTKKRNESGVKIENSTYMYRGSPTQNSTSVGVNLRLPNFEEYWHLKFTDYDEQQERRNVREGYLRQNPREKNYGATVGLFKKLGDVKTSFQPRIELRDPLQVSHSLSFESMADLKTYQVNPRLELFALADKGTGIFTSLNVHYILTKIYSFTLINQGEYFDKGHMFYGANGFALTQKVMKNSSLNYSWIFSSINQPSYRLQGYSLAVSWTHLWYRKILEYQVSPYVDFQAPENFRGNPGLTFNVSLNF